MSVVESKIVLPPAMDAFFSESGYCESTFYEGRRNPRLRIRCRGAMSIEESPPSIHRTERQAIVYLKDISKRGIGILTHTQLFPQEKILLLFQQRKVTATIVRCRRIGELCWECGGLITSFANLEDDA